MLRNLQIWRKRSKNKIILKRWTKAELYSEFKNVYHNKKDWTINIERDNSKLTRDNYTIKELCNFILILIFKRNLT